MAPRWLRLEDHLPSLADAIYVPGLALTWDESRLTSMNRVCVEEGARLIREGRAKSLIISGCYGEELSARELGLRMKILLDAGIDPGVIKQISGITSTADEIVRLARVLEELGAKSLVFVSDEFHIPRAVLLARHSLRGVKIFHRSVRTPRYEFTSEPNLIKVLRCGFKPLWIITNVASYFVTKYLVKKNKI